MITRKQRKFALFRSLIIQNGYQPYGRKCDFPLHFPDFIKVSKTTDLPPSEIIWTEKKQTDHLYAIAHIPNRTGKQPSERTRRFVQLDAEMKY